MNILITRPLLESEDLIGKLFSLDIYTNDDFSNDSIKSTSSNSNMSPHSNISNASNGSNLSNNSKLSSNSEKSIYSEISNNSLSTCDSVNDYIININNIPVQNLFIEQLEGTLDKILFDEDASERWEEYFGERF